jgi:hypothetical protein
MGFRPVQRLPKLGLRPMISIFCHDLHEVSPVKGFVSVGTMFFQQLLHYPKHTVPATHEKHQSTTCNNLYVRDGLESWILDHA